MRRFSARLERMENSKFSGAKVAVLVRGQVLALLRDDTPGLPYPGMWDLPGGGRELRETPVECAMRETFEETGLRINPGCVVWERAYARAHPGLSPTWFMVAEPGWLALPPLRLGDEGQEVRWMPLHDYLTLSGAIVHLQDRLRDFLAEKELRAWRAARSG